MPTCACDPDEQSVADLPCEHGCEGGVGLPGPNLGEDREATLRTPAATGRGWEAAPASSGGRPRLGASPLTCAPEGRRCCTRCSCGGDNKAAAGRTVRRECGAATVTATRAPAWPRPSARARYPPSGIRSPLPRSRRPGARSASTAGSWRCTARAARRARGPPSPEGGSERGRGEAGRVRAQRRWIPRTMSHVPFIRARYIWPGRGAGAGKSGNVSCCTFEQPRPSAGEERHIRPRLDEGRDQLVVHVGDLKLLGQDVAPANATGETGGSRNERNEQPGKSPPGRRRRTHARSTSKPVSNVAFPAVPPITICSCA